MFKRILISTDFSEASRPAIGKGIQLAGLCGAEVEVVHVVSDIKESLLTGILDRGAQMKWEATLETDLDLALPDEAYPGARKSLLRGASIPGEILKHAVQGHFDLIVCGSHGRRLFTRALLGSVAQELGRNSTVPVLIVPPNDLVRFSNGIERILVPMDFSPPSLDALELAIRLASTFHSTIIVLHAIYRPAYLEMRYMDPAFVINVASDPQLKADAISRMEQVLARKNAISNATKDVIFGEPAEKIIQYAEENDCTCIVMGSHGRKGLERAILGSVTTNILARTKVPVFTIAPRF